MKFLADVNVPKPFILRLRDDGHEVLSVLDINRRLHDPTIIRVALDEQAIVLTLDRDYW
jgi:predicted nuclease of predicted toxin-antitoxin system